MSFRTWWLWPGKSFSNRAINCLVSLLHKVRPGYV